VVSASGPQVTKAVTVAELLKKRQSNLKQHTEIKYVRVEDVWEPDQTELDQLKVTRKIPALSITLVQTSGETGRGMPGEKDTH
jgi:DNA-binding protein